MSKLALEYFYLVFLAVIGVVQAAAAYNQLHGLCLFRHTISAYIFALLLVSPVGFLLYTWNERNPVGVIEGLQQALYFFLGTLCAILFTLIVSSLVNQRRFSSVKPDREGLEALRNATFYQAIRHRVSRER